MDFKKIPTELKCSLSFDDFVKEPNEAFNNLKMSSEIEKIIVNGTCTIMFFKDGRKITANVHDEEFDAEKGILMCIVKAHGITHSSIRKLMEVCDGHDEKGLLMYLIKKIGYKPNEIKELVKSIKYQGMKPKNANKVKEVKRLARAGEYVRIVENYKFNKDEIVRCITECGDGVHLFSNNDEEWFLKQKRYVVLEGYKPETK